jgi:proteic killer suppression protein
MKLRNIQHKGLRRLITQNDPAGLHPQCVAKLRNMLGFMLEMADVQELRSIPGWRFRALGGDQKGRFSLTVNRNWRLTFGVDVTGRELIDLDYEDYH